MSSKSEAKIRIGRAVEQIPGLMGLGTGSSEFIRWKRSTKIAISNLFGEGSSHVQDLDRISFSPAVAFGGMDTSIYSRSYQSGLTRAKAILESMLDEIDEYWDDDCPQQFAPETQEIPIKQATNRVFVVHGRDDGARNTVARFLESLELEPIILQERPNEGRTVIQKFEDYSGVSFAVVLCTPDDVGRLNSEGEELRPRPRQNVILELGFFWGRLGRNKVCALLEGDMEMPSDYGGVLYIPIDDSEGWKLTLARELRAAGMTIDMNLIV